jgi:uncharacterized phage protein (TIGR02218 family)
MKTASAALINLLNTTVDKFYMADLFTITLNNGSIFRYTNHDINLTVGGNLYLSVPIERGSLSNSAGINVDELEITIHADDNFTISGTPIIQLFQTGTFDNAYLQLDRVFSPTPWTFPMPNISSDYVLSKQFLGRIDTPEIYSTTATLKAKSLTQLLNLKMPRNLIQSTCGNTLYDGTCGLTRATYQVNSYVTAESTATIIYASGLTQTAGYFSQGVIEFTSGTNLGLKRTVKTHAASGILTMILYFPNAPAINDTFTIVPGCDKSMATCQNTFNNLRNYRGMPFVPLPETTL